MFHAYVLRSLKHRKLYIGHAEDVGKRIREHNAGRVAATKHRIPFVLLYTTEFLTRSEARWQERQWKTAWGHKQLAKRLDSVPV